MNSKDYFTEHLKIEEYYKEHYIQGFFRNCYHFILWGIPRRLQNLKTDIIFGFQRMFRGYDNSAYWDLHSYIAEIALPVLKWYKVNAHGVPMVDGFENKPFDEQMTEWNRILDKMIAGFQAIDDDNRMVDGWDKISLTERKVIVDEGMALFGKYFQALWD